MVEDESKKYHNKVSSIKFLDDQLLKISTLKLINKYIQEKENQISKENKNPKRYGKEITNIGALVVYIKKH